MDHRQFGDHLYALRKEYGYSQFRLGKLLGVSDKAVSKWETGNAMPKSDALRKMASLYHVSLDQLMNIEVSSANSEEIQKPVVNMKDTRAAIQKRIDQSIEVMESLKAIGGDATDSPFYPLFHDFHTALPCLQLMMEVMDNNITITDEQWTSCKAILRPVQEMLRSHVAYSIAFDDDLPGAMNPDRQLADAIDVGLVYLEQAMEVGSYHSTEEVIALEIERCENFVSFAKEGFYPDIPRDTLAAAIQDVENRSRYYQLCAEVLNGNDLCNEDDIDLSDKLFHLTRAEIQNYPEIVDMGDKQLTELRRWTNEKDCDDLYRALGECYTQLKHGLPF